MLAVLDAMVTSVSRATRDRKAQLGAMAQTATQVSKDHKECRASPVTPGFQEPTGLMGTPVKTEPRVQAVTAETTARTARTEQRATLEIRAPRATEVRFSWGMLSSTCLI